MSGYCDKKRPECSQCIRVGKKCPGYRDQLSLMFRDESSKVIQKAHAQWGSSGSPIDASGSTAGSSSSAWGNESLSGSSDSPSSSTPSPPQDVVSARLPKRMDLNMEEQGMQFYINRYLMNHPDSPRTRDQVAAYCAAADTTQNVMIAVGLAGLSNLQGDKNLNLIARSQYVAALKHTGQLIAANDPASLVARVRSVVTLALFEVVQGKGPKSTVSSANTHINGAVAVLRSVLPLPPSATSDGGSGQGSSQTRGGYGIIMLLFSMLIPYQLTDTPLPPAFFDTLKFCRYLMQSMPESCACDHVFASARLLQLLAIVEHTVLTDGRPATEDLIRQFLLLEDTFDALEDPHLKAFPYEVKQGDCPPEAVFRGKWHVYDMIWGARIWNHYRWARILANQNIVKFVTKYPISSRKTISAARRAKSYATIDRMAQDILISTPSHWHHPMLDPKDTLKFESNGPGSSGAVGLPSLLWHVVIAGCAPNVPLEYWNWAHNVLLVVWKQLGMQHALALAEIMEEHKAKLDREATKQKFKLEFEDE
ncbi:SAGA complex subunit Sgf73 [Hypoxylon texense]